MVESYIVKEGKAVEYKRTALIDDSKPVKHFVSIIKDESKIYKKHRSYIDNCSNVFRPMKMLTVKNTLSFDFSQNHTIRSKLEVQSAHFSNKQYTLHCAIAKPFDKQYNHDDTKHDGTFVHHVLRHIIIHCSISNEDLWVQSDNASPQYKSKHSFGLLQSLADEFNLRVIRTYGAAGHGKGAIDTMSSFGVKNILRKGIVTHDVFFNNSCDMAEYLASKNPQNYYNTTRQKDGGPIEITGLYEAASHHFQT